MSATVERPMGIPLRDADASTPGAESWRDGRLVLPGGIVLADGTRLQEIRIRELTGHDEEILADRRYTNAVEQVTDLLGRVILGVDGLGDVAPRAVAESLLVGDRDYLLLRLRQVNVGDAVHQVMRCPSPQCGEKVDVEFLVSELPVRRPQHLEAGVDLAFGEPAFGDDPSSDRARVRWPNGQDHAAVAPWLGTNASRANSVLFARIVSQLGRRARLGEDDARALPMRVRQQLTQYLDHEAPGPDLRIEVACPHCHGDMTYGFDLAEFFFWEVRMSRDQLYEQVHFLALHYHWGEHEVLSLPRGKRLRYLELLERHLAGVAR